MAGVAGDRQEVKADLKMLLTITGALTTSAEMPSSKTLNLQQLRETVRNKSEALSSSLRLKPQQQQQQLQQIITGVTTSAKNPHKAQKSSWEKKAEQLQRTSTQTTLQSRVIPTNFILYIYSCKRGYEFKALI